MRATIPFLNIYQPKVEFLPRERGGAVSFVDTGLHFHTCVKNFHPKFLNTLWEFAFEMSKNFPPESGDRCLLIKFLPY
jgi:hypothetical protein